MGIDSLRQMKGKNMNMKKVLINGSAIVVSCLMAASTIARDDPPPTGGSCDSVRQESGSRATFFVPGGTGPFPVLGWGNGTGGSVRTYEGLLEAAAEKCVIVAAATTSSSGSGTAVASAVRQAISRYNTNSVACTSGHSQGGGGSFNAARDLGSSTDCVIAVQPDTRFTTRIEGPVSRNTNVVCIFSSGDTLAPRSGNERNCRNNSPGTYVTENTSGSHFTPTSGTGGSVGRVMREYIDNWML